MPNSYNFFKKDIKNYIYSNFNKNIKILDIGPGCGTYADLLSDYKNIDAVEIYEPYIKKFNLLNKYQNVYVSNILNFDFDYYDLIILGDVLEHIETNKAKNLITKLYNKCNELIVNVPYLADFNYKYENEPNKNELHLQVDLTSSIMFQRYPELKLKWENEYIGVYIKNENIPLRINNKAIYVYVDNDYIIQEEFKWLYKTWILTKSFENWDLVVFHHPDVKIPNHKNLIKIPKYPSYKYNSFWEKYKFIESIDFMKDYDDLNNNYEWILKTDCDVFLTKNFKNLNTESTLVGMGGYNDRSPEISKNLDRIANILKINRNYRFTNIGSTILTRSKNLTYLMGEIRKLTYYLLNNDFKTDKGKYPGWFKGCSSMYAQELICNHYFSDNFSFSGLDIKPYFGRKIGNTDYQIHAFPTNDDFSKEKFFKKYYKGKEYKNYNFNTIKGYCFHVAQLDIEKLSKYF